MGMKLISNCTWEGKDISAVVMDLDDTLYPEEMYIKSGFQEVSKYIAHKYGLRQKNVFDDLWGTYLDGIRGSNFDEFFRRRNIVIKKEEIIYLRDLYRQHVPEIELPNESRKFIENLRRIGMKTGILSNGYIVSQENKIKALGLKSMVDEIILTDMLGKDFWKPNEKAFVEMAKVLSVRTDQCVYIGDNPKKDFKGAKKCGYLTIQLRCWTKKPLSQFNEDNAHYVAESFDDIEKLIIQNKGRKDEKIES